MSKLQMKITFLVGLTVAMLSPASKGQCMEPKNHLYLQWPGGNSGSNPSRRHIRF